MKKVITISGHLDANTSAAVERDIKMSLQDVPTTSELVIDASDLQYISSTGLRVILALNKTYSNVEVINLSPEVYNVFELTGFTRILKVSKALRKMSIAGCEKIGQGGVGAIYRIDGDTIIKVFMPDCDISIPERERVMAKESFVLGMPTAIPYDIVWVTDTQSYGLVFELISSGTLSAAIKANPDRLEEYARIFATEMKHLHSIHVPEGTLAHTSDVLIGDLERIARHFSAEEVQLIRDIIDAIPESDRLLHNDCHPKNVMFNGAGDDELILIDMGEVSSGHPLIDLSHTYSSLHIENNFEDIIGFPKELAEPFWLSFLRYYFDTDDEAQLACYNEMIAVAAMTRTCCWIALSDYPQEVIDGVRAYADNVFLPQKDYILSVIPKFREFPVDN